MDEQKKQQQREKLIMKVLSHLRDYEFIHMNMEEMAKLMGISRATLYKYFANKEEIFENFTEGLITYFEQHEVEELSERNVESLFQLIFEQSTSLALLVPDSFMEQFAIVYPAMHDRLYRTIQQRNERVKDFYRAGMEQNLFKKVNPQLLVAQQQLFETLFDTKFLMQNELTVEQALWDFYNLQKQQLFKESELQTFNDEAMQPKMTYLTNKIMNVIF